MCEKSRLSSIIDFAWCQPLPITICEPNTQLSSIKLRDETRNTTFLRTSLPFKLRYADIAVCVSGYSQKPNPFGFPVSLSNTSLGNRSVQNRVKVRSTESSQRVQPLRISPWAALHAHHTGCSQLQHQRDKKGWAKSTEHTSLPCIVIHVDPTHNAKSDSGMQENWESGCVSFLVEISHAIGRRVKNSR